MDIDTTDVLIHLAAGEFPAPAIDEAMNCQSPEEILAMAQKYFDIAFKAGYLFKQSEDLAEMYYVQPHMEF